MHILSGKSKCIRGSASREKERERDWCMHILSVKSKCIGGSASRERERDACVCVFFLNFVILFNSENLPTYFKVSCRSLQKILIVRDVLG